MDHLPITYYRIGQTIEINDFDNPHRAEVAELTEKHIGYYFGQERNSIRYVRSVAPDFVKPVLRPLRELRISHVIELYRRSHPDECISDDTIIEVVSDRPQQIMVWGDTLDAGLWLQSLGYDIEGLIKKGLAVQDEV